MSVAPTRPYYYQEEVTEQRTYYSKLSQCWLRPWSFFCSEQDNSSPKKLHHAKPKRLPKINTGHTNDAERIKHFTSSFENNFHNNLSTDATTKCNNLPNATYKAAVETYGRMVRTNADWNEANLNVMKPLTAAKRSALIQYRKVPNRKNLVSLQEARRKVNSWQENVQPNTGWNSAP